MNRLLFCCRVQAPSCLIMHCTTTINNCMHYNFFLKFCCAEGVIILFIGLGFHLFFKNTLMLVTVQFGSDHSPRIRRCCPRGIGLWQRNTCWESRRAQKESPLPLENGTGCSRQSPHLKCNGERKRRWRRISNRQCVSQSAKKEHTLIETYSRDLARS